MKIFHLHLSEELHYALRIAAAQRRTTMRDLVLKAIEAEIGYSEREEEVNEVVRT